MLSLQSTDDHVHRQCISLLVFSIRHLFFGIILVIRLWLKEQNSYFKSVASFCPQIGGGAVYAKKP
jgi:hypothetical protein